MVFVSPGEFLRFQQWIAEALEDGSLIEIPADEDRVFSKALEERWFKA